MDNNKQRCKWCNTNNPTYVDYHDNEWGVPLHDDLRLFELLLLETFQAGLSWECILNKREAFRRAFDGFDYQRIANYDSEKVQALLKDKGIVRNRRKIEAAVNNARVYQEIKSEWGSFDRYIWSFAHNRTTHEVGRTTSPLSDTISGDMRRRGMKFVGSTTVYAYLQAIGIINSHETDCWLTPQETIETHEK